MCVDHVPTVIGPGGETLSFGEFLSPNVSCHGVTIDYVDEALVGGRLCEEGLEVLELEAKKSR